MDTQRHDDAEMSTREYWDAKAAERKADYAEAQRIAQTPAERMHHLDMIATNIGLSDATREAARIEMHQIRQAMQVQEDTEWTREVTITRRAAWNDAVRNGERRQGKIEMNLGFSLATLKRQVARHSL